MNLVTPSLLKSYFLSLFKLAHIRHQYPTVYSGTLSRGLALKQTLFYHPLSILQEADSRTYNRQCHQAMLTLPVVWPVA